jgi:hypothetical protein
VASPFRGALSTEVENRRKTGEAVRQGAAFFVVRARSCGLIDQAAAEADGDRMGPRAGLELGEQVTDVALDRLLAQIQANADLPVHEAVGDQLQNLDFAGSRLLTAFLHRRLEGDHLRDRLIAPRCHRLEPSRVLAIPAQDLIALGSVHEAGIGTAEALFRTLVPQSREDAISGCVLGDLALEHRLHPGPIVVDDRIPG